MNPYAIAGSLALLIAVAFGGAQTGRKLERGVWQAKEIATASAVLAETVAAQDRYVRAQKFNEATARKASTDHAQALSALTAQYDAARAAIRNAGGLRVSSAICDPHAGTTESSGAGRLDAAGAGTVQLSDRTQDDLYALAKRADELAERLRALQGWVRASGGYGDTQ